MMIKSGNYVVIMEPNLETPPWNTLTQSREFLKTYLLLELLNKMALLKEEIELSLKLEELWSLQLAFLCYFRLKLSTQCVIPKIAPSLLTAMGKLPMSYLREGNHTSLTFMCLSVLVTF